MELSKLFVSPTGLLCLDMGDYTVLDVGLNSIEDFGFVGFCHNVFSIYESRFMMFMILKTNYGLFPNEDYIEGLYSVGYLLELRAQFSLD